MKTILQPLAIGLVALASAPSGALAQIGNAPAHTIVSSQEIKWSPGPASLAPGAEMAVLHGDPAKEGLFVMRLKGTSKNSCFRAARCDVWARSVFRGF